MKTSKYDYFSQIMKQDYEKCNMPTLLYISKQYFSAKKHDRPMHSHDGICEILLVCEGSGVYAIRDKLYSVQQGDVLFYNQGDTHELRSTSDGEIGSYCFGMQNVKFNNLPFNHITPEACLPVRSSGPMFTFLHNLCEQAYLLLEADDLLGKATAQSLATTLLLLVNQLEEQPLLQLVSSDQDTEFSQRIRAYLDQHYTERITLKSIAAHFNCSEPYISHVFKEATGFSPIQYVIRRRIGLAQTHLIASEYTATQISTLVGYDNTNYFNTTFTRIVGISPIRYRKKYLASLHGNPTQ